MTDEARHQCPRCGRSFAASHPGIHTCSAPSTPLPAAPPLPSAIESELTKQFSQFLGQVPRTTLGDAMLEMARTAQDPDEDPLRAAMMESWFLACEAFMRRGLAPDSLLHLAALIVNTRAMRLGQPPDAVLARVGALAAQHRDQKVRELEEARGRS